MEKIARATGVKVANSDILKTLTYLNIKFSNYLPIDEKAASARIADKANSVDWNNVTGKPDFPSALYPQVYRTDTSSGTIPSGGTWQVIAFSSGDAKDSVYSNTVAGGTNISISNWGGESFIFAIRIA